MEKEEVLSNLYGLRAGLSVISEQKDEICKNKDIYANDLSDCEDKMIDSFCDIYQARWGIVPVAKIGADDDPNDHIAKFRNDATAPTYIRELQANSSVIEDYDTETAEIIKNAIQNLTNIDQKFKYSENATAKYVTTKDFADPQFNDRYNTVQTYTKGTIYLEIINKGQISPDHCEYFELPQPWTIAHADYEHFKIYRKSRYSDTKSAIDVSNRLSNHPILGGRMSDYTPYHKRRAKTVYRDQYMHYIESADTQEQIDRYLETKPQTPPQIQKTTSALKVGIPVAILIAAVLSVIAFFVTQSIFDGNILGYILGIGGSVIIGVIILCIAIVKDKANKKRSSKESAQTAEKANANLESGKASIHKYLAARKKYIEVKDNRSEYYSKKIAPYKVVGDAVYVALVAEYSSLLDPRDWKWIDLIIYYFETGRADNIRDALLLADKERQTQQIIASIKEASQNICTTINDGFMMIKNTMIRCFDNLTNTINSGFNKLNGTIQQGIATNNSLMLANLNATRLQNSLIAKSNQTSEQLMEDVHYIRMNVMN